MNTSSYNTKFGTLAFSQKVGDEYFGRLHSNGKVISIKKLYSCLFLCLAILKPSRLILLLLLKKSLPVQINSLPKLFLIFKNNC